MTIQCCADRFENAKEHPDGYYYRVIFDTIEICPCDDCAEAHWEAIKV